jgi:Holliday junction resolvase RusA-like endonuclease
MKKILGKISLRKFEPKTSKTKKDVARKIELRNKIRGSRSNLPQIRKDCEGKKISLRIKFRLSKQQEENVSKYRKDLDNMLKIVLDVFPEYMDNNKTNKGLGLIDNDESVYEIKAEKIFVDTDVEQGIDIEISRVVIRKNRTR